MGYIDNKTLVVEATLTSAGRLALATTGQLNITSFALADDEIDYGLYNPAAAIPDLGIINTPVFDPSSNETQTMLYKLVTLPAGTTSIPEVFLNIASINIVSTSNTQVVVTPSTSPSNYNSTLGYTAILSNGQAGTIVVTSPLSSTISNIPQASTFAGNVASQNSQTVVGFAFAFIPSSNLNQSIVTTLTVIGNESGGSISIPVYVNASN